MKYDYILGLDIGISSVGWAMLALNEENKPYRIINAGSRIFSPGEVEKTGASRAQARRETRGSRRLIRRREFRLDRVRNLLYEEGYLSGNVTSNVVSIINNELTEIYIKMINNYYREHETNPYKLKVEALDRKLSNDELAIILVHYAKKRGYKSNREDKSENDTGKVLSAIDANKDIMAEKKYRTISEMLIKDEKFSKKIKNSPNNYQMSVENEDYLKEINFVLDTQIKFGTINEEFKNKYLKIYNSRRSYAKGPGGNSKYGGNLIERMVGKCKFDNQPRAPKYAYSSELFVALSKLVNLRYKESDGEYKSLIGAEITKIVDLAKNKTQVTYLDVQKVIGQDIKIKDLSLNIKEFKKVIEDLHKALDIPSSEKINIKELNEDDTKKYLKLYNEQLMSKNFIQLKGYHDLRKAITKSFGKEEWNNISSNISALDDLVLFSTNYKDNSDIINAIKNSPNLDDKYADNNFVKLLENYKDHLMLSTDIIRKLIPIMEQGKTYDKAMEELGYNHYNLTENIEKKSLLVPISKCDNITNQRVIRSLTQSRKVINAIIKKYGTPKVINIETARELAKTMDERNKIAKAQAERQGDNERIRQELFEKGFFTDPRKITSTDILKYKLWTEQKEYCPYSLKKITLDDIYVNNLVQIDHILPYSRTFNDNYLNKTLVFTKYNQEKGNKTPFEWIGNGLKWEEYKSFINSLTISPLKKENYLLKDLSLDVEREMREQNLNDTKYISKELYSLIKAYLDVPNVNVYQGAITAKLRARWGFNRLTHSYISETYNMPSEMKQGIQKDRDNHLHHAMDAIVIASMTKSLQNKITLYEKFSRYIDGLTKNMLLNLNSDELKETIGEFYDDETGEVKEIDLKEYLKKQFAANNITFLNHDIGRLKFPVPYETFVEEAKIRVYERNEEILKFKLKGLGTYTNEELKKVHVLTPSFAKSKISGAMHKDTLVGLKQFNNDDSNITYKTSRIPIEKVTPKNLESLIKCNPSGGTKDIYEAIHEWLGSSSKGEDALKEHNGKYPVSKNDKENKEIKRVKIYEEYKNTGHNIRNANVEKGDIYRIVIYKSKNKEDSKLYAVGLDIFDIKKIEKYNAGKLKCDFNLKLEYGQGSNFIIKPYKDIVDNFEEYIILNKNDLIKIICGENSTIAYVCGYSGGQLEVKSTIGDGYDLVGKNNVFNNLIGRYFKTISAIDDIKKLSINTLGEISGI